MTGQDRKFLSHIATVLENIQSDLDRLRAQDAVTALHLIKQTNKQLDQLLTIVRNAANDKH